MVVGMDQLPDARLVVDYPRRRLVLDGGPEGLRPQCGE